MYTFVILILSVSLGRLSACWQLRSLSLSRVLFVSSSVEAFHLQVWLTGLCFVSRTDVRRHMLSIHQKQKCFVTLKSLQHFNYLSTLTQILSSKIRLQNWITHGYIFSETKAEWLQPGCMLLNLSSLLCYEPAVCYKAIFYYFFYVADYLNPWDMAWEWPSLIATLLRLYLQWKLLWKWCFLCVSNSLQFWPITPALNPGRRLKLSLCCDSLEIHRYYSEPHQQKQLVCLSFPGAIRLTWLR